MEFPNFVPEPVQTKLSVLLNEGESLFDQTGWEGQLARAEAQVVEVESAMKVALQADDTEGIDNLRRKKIKR